MQVRALVGLHGMGRWEGQGGDYMSSSEVSCPISVGNVPLIDVPDRSLRGEGPRQPGWSAPSHMVSSSTPPRSGRGGADRSLPKQKMLPATRCCLC